jgi:hypothetical protein
MASMSETHGAVREDPHAGESMVGPHGGADDHGDTHGHDDHAHEGMELGPIDRVAWLMAGLGILLGLVVAAAFIAATS